MRYLLFIISILIVTISTAQPLDSDKWEEWRMEYKEGDKPQKEEPEEADLSWLDSFGDVPLAASAIKILVIGLIVFAVGYVVFFLLDRGQYLSTRKRVVSKSLIQEADLPQDAQADVAVGQEGLDVAIEQGDYVQAIRSYYWMTIQRLHESGQIKWTPDKTNGTYLNELASSDDRTIFRL